MKRLPKRALVSEINPVNLMLFWLLSFVMRVDAYSIHRACPRFISRRIALLDLDTYVSWSNAPRFRSDAVRLWERLLEKFPENDWTLRFGGHELDFSTKAKQDLAGHFERFLLLQEARRKIESDSKVYLIESPQIRYLKKLDPSADFFDFPNLAGISRLNMILSQGFDYLFNLAQMCRLTQRILFSCLPSGDRQSRPVEPIPFLWDAVGPNELTLDTERRSFSWIVDDAQITPEKILFILPGRANIRIKSGTNSPDRQAFTIREIYKIVSVGILLGAALRLLLFMVGNFFQAYKGLPRTQLTGYFLALMRFRPVIDHFRPRCYINTVSHLAVEEPIIVYLKAINVATVMCCYSANAHGFSDERQAGNFRSVRFAHILASRIAVWNEDYKKDLLEHPQDEKTIDVIGPLMVGDENVFDSPQNVLRSTFVSNLKDKDSDIRYISFFDIATLSKEFKSETRIYGDPYTEEYTTSFLRDMMRLLEDFEDIVLVFKPKRSLIGKDFFRNSEFHGLLADLEGCGRGLVLDDDINPWIPVALADLCIGMPFTSPPLAAMHHGIPGLFHDPTGIALHHRYRGVDHLITHDYDQLRSQVQSLAHESPRYNGRKEVVWGQAHSFIGEYPGTNSSDRFRQILRKIAIQER